jgi:5-methylcytosine-specific restriction endonuclease McrA
MMYCSKACASAATGIALVMTNRRTTRTIYETKEWRKIARDVRKRDAYTCQACGSVWQRGQRPLDVHHKIPVRVGGTDDMGNLTALCRRCHIRADATLRRQEKATRPPS